MAAVTDITYMLVRHGEAEGNREHRFIGQTDVPLSELGRAQASRVSRRLSGQPINRIIASDLQRARHTLEPLAAETGVDVRLDARLREISNGDWARLLPTEIEAGWPDLWTRYRGGEDVPRPNGERWADVQARVLQAIHEDAGSADDGDVVAVASHGGPILGLVRWVLGVDRGSYFGGPVGPVANASITTLRLRRQGESLRPTLLGINDVGHLGELVTDPRLRVLER